MTDPIAAAREFLRELARGKTTYWDDAVPHLEALLAEIDQQYTQGYTDAIEDALERCYNKAAAEKIAALRPEEGGERNGDTLSESQKTGLHIGAEPKSGGTNE